MRSRLALTLAVATLGLFALAFPLLALFGAIEVRADPSTSPAAAYGKLALAATTATAIPSTKSINARHGILVVNLDTARVWCGWDSSVTDATGFPVEPGGGMRSWEIGYNSPAQVSLWCYSVAGMTSPNDLRWQEVR